MADIGFPSDAVERGWFTRDAAGNVTLSDKFYGDVHAIASQDMFWPNSTLAYSNALRSLGFTGDVSTPTQAVDMIPLVADNGTPNPNTQWVRDMLTVTLAGGNAPVSPVADPAAAQNLQTQLTQSYGERLAATPVEAAPAATNTGFFAPDAVARGWVANGTDGVALTDKFYSDLDAALRTPTMETLAGRPASISVAMQTMGIPQEFAQNFYNNLDLARSEGHFDMAAIRPQLERAMIGAGTLTADGQIPALQANFTARLTAQFGTELPAAVPEAVVAADATVTPAVATPADTVAGTTVTPTIVTPTAVTATVITPITPTDTITPVVADAVTPVRADTIAGASVMPTIATPVTPTVITPVDVTPTDVTPVVADAAVPVTAEEATPVDTAAATILPGDANKDGTLAARVLGAIGTTIISPVAAATLPGGSLVGADTIAATPLAADTVAGTAVPADTITGTSTTPGAATTLTPSTVPGSASDGLIHTNPGDPIRDITFTQDAWDYRMQLVREEAARAGDVTAMDPAQMAADARQDTLQTHRDLAERQRVISAYTQYGELRRQGEALANATVPGAGATPVGVTPDVTAGITPGDTTAAVVANPVVTNPVVTNPVVANPAIANPAIANPVVNPVTADGTTPITVTSTAVTPAAVDPRTNTERALATLMAMDRSGMSEERMEAAMLREAGLYVNLLAPNGRKYSGAALQEQIEALQPGQLVGITLMGSGRTAVMQLLASTPARTADGASLRDMSVDASMAALYTPDSRGLMDAHTQSVRDALERVATRTGHGTRWLETTITNTNRTITQNLADRGIEASTGMSAAAIFAQFDAKVAAHTAVAPPAVTPAVTADTPLLTSDATLLPGQTNPALRAALPVA